MEQEYNRRLWWALYVLDYDIASRFGNPCAIAHDVTGNQRQFPTEEVSSSIFRSFLIADLLIFSARLLAQGCTHPRAI